MDKLNQAAKLTLSSLLTMKMLMVAMISVVVSIFILIGFILLTSILSAMIFQSFSAAIGGFLFSVIIAWILFPGIMPVVVNFFDIRIIKSIEQASYPHLPEVQDSSFWPELFHDLKFTMFTLFLNVIMLPIYFLPVINVIIFYSMNGYLLGKEFFIVAARRRIGMASALQLFRQNRRDVFLAGLSLSVFATLPVLNLFAPLWGIALMVHLFHIISGKSATLVITNQPQNAI